jgi:hypothetical protein
MSYHNVSSPLVLACAIRRVDRPVEAVFFSNFSSSKFRAFTLGSIDTRVEGEHSWTISAAVTVDVGDKSHLGGQLVAENLHRYTTGPYSSDQHLLVFQERTASGLENRFVGSANTGRALFASGEAAELSQTILAPWIRKSPTICRWFKRGKKLRGVAQRVERALALSPGTLDFRHCKLVNSSGHRPTDCKVCNGTFDSVERTFVAHVRHDAVRGVMKAHWLTTAGIIDNLLESGEVHVEILENAVPTASGKILSDAEKLHAFFTAYSEDGRSFGKIIRRTYGPGSSVYSPLGPSYTPSPPHSPLDLTMLDESESSRNRAQSQG